MEPFTGAQDPYAGLAANLGVIPADSGWSPTGFTYPNDPSTYTTFYVSSVNGVPYGSGTANGSSDLVNGLGSVSNPSTVIGSTTVYYAQVTVSINQESKNPSFDSLDNTSSPVVIGITATNTYPSATNPNQDPNLDPKTSLTVVLEPVSVQSATPNIRVVVQAYDATTSTYSYSIDTANGAAVSAYSPQGATDNPADPNNTWIVMDANGLTQEQQQIAQRYPTPISALASVVNTTSGAVYDYNLSGVIFEEVVSSSSSPYPINKADSLLGDKQYGFSYVTGMEFYTGSSLATYQVMAPYGSYTAGWLYNIYDGDGVLIAAAQDIGAGAFWLDPSVSAGITGYKYTVQFYYGAWGNGIDLYPPQP
jgi:hypothetical protein